MSVGFPRDVFYHRYRPYNSVGIDHINFKNSDGDTPLHCAIRSRNINSIQSKINLGADLELTNRWGETPLLYAARKCNFQAVSLLLRSRANIYATNVDGDTAIHAAIRRCDVNMLKKLIDFGFIIEQKNTRGETPLFFAARKWNYRALELLLHKGATIDALNRSNESAFNYAVRHKNREMVNYLFDKGANTDLPTKDGCVSLFYCLKYDDDSEMIRKLLKLGVNIDFKDRDGNNALHIALKNERKDVYRELMKAGVDLYKYNKMGKTPIDLAVQFQDTHFIDEQASIDCKLYTDLDVDALEAQVSSELEEFNMMTTNFETLRVLINHISVSSGTIKSELKRYQSDMHYIMSEYEALTFEDAFIKLLHYKFPDPSYLKHEISSINKKISSLICTINKILSKEAQMYSEYVHPDSPHSDVSDNVDLEPTKSLSAEAISGEISRFRPDTPITPESELIGTRTMEFIEEAIVPIEEEDLVDDERILVTSKKSFDSQSSQGLNTDAKYQQLRSSLVELVSILERIKLLPSVNYDKINKYLSPINLLMDYELSLTIEEAISQISLFLFQGIFEISYSERYQLILDQLNVNLRQLFIEESFKDGSSYDSLTQPEQLRPTEDVSQLFSTRNLTHDSTRVVQDTAPLLRMLSVFNTQSAVAFADRVRCVRLIGSVPRFDCLGSLYVIDSIKITGESHNDSPRNDFQYELLEFGDFEFDTTNYFRDYNLALESIPKLIQLISKVDAIPGNKLALLEYRFRELCDILQIELRTDAGIKNIIEQLKKFDIAFGVFETLEGVNEMIHSLIVSINNLEVEAINEKTPISQPKTVAHFLDSGFHERSPLSRQTVNDEAESFPPKMRPLTLKVQESRKENHWPDTPERRDFNDHLSHMCTAMCVSPELSVAMVQLEMSSPQSSGVNRSTRLPQGRISTKGKQKSGVSKQLFSSQSIPDERSIELDPGNESFDSAVGVSPIREDSEIPSVQVQTVSRVVGKKWSTDPDSPGKEALIRELSSQDLLTKKWSTDPDSPGKEALIRELSSQVLIHDSRHYQYGRSPYRGKPVPFMIDDSTDESHASGSLTPPRQKLPNSKVDSREDRSYTNYMSRSTKSGAQQKVNNDWIRTLRN